MKKPYIAWGAVILPMWLVLVACTHWEPVANDGWGHWSWHHEFGLSFDNLYDFAKLTYLRNNPRLGQVITVLLYTPGPYHSIVTPIVELGLFYALTALVLGRWPSLRRADDALLFATIFAMAAVTVPAFGLMLFYRPFTGNYLYGLAINLALLLPYRFHYESARTARWWHTPLMGVLGFAAGLCNEHTGPAIAAMLLACIWACRKQLAGWMFAGLIGFVLGGLALLFAPGQAFRYGGLANQHGVLDRILERGIGANERIFVAAVLYLKPLVGWVVLGLVARWRVRRDPQPHNQLVAELALGALALAITLTLLASPKQGARLYLASVVIACAAVAAWVLAQCVSRWARTVLAALATIVLAHMVWRCIPTYRTLDREFAERVRMLENAPDNSIADIPVYSVPRSRWSVGDDLLNEDVRNRVSATFGLALVRMHQRDETTPPDGDDPDAP
jgi:hypothetical protein